MHPPHRRRPTSAPFAGVRASIVVTTLVTASVLVPGLTTATPAAAEPRSPRPPRPGAVACFVPPVEAPVTDPFRMPPCPYCAGNRGIEYGPRRGDPVVAMADGEVVFTGTVAGTRWLVVGHADGRRASYGHLASVSVAAGDRVRAGQRVGTTTDRFYVGLRDGDRPVDPTPLLGSWRRRARLVPLDGTPAPPAGPPRLVCPNPSRGR